MSPDDIRRGSILTGMSDIKDDAIETLLRQPVRDAEQGGYRINPDAAFTKALVRGLLVNKGRYGYTSCPCRLSTGRKADDLDIVCPVPDHRDRSERVQCLLLCPLRIGRHIQRPEETRPGAGAQASHGPDRQ